MCIIIHAPVGKIIPKEYIIESDFNNPDGVGLMWNDGERVHTYKNLTDVNKVYSKYKKIAGKYPVVLHFRIGTSGGNDYQNIHPFPLFDTQLVHNGVLNIKVPTYSKINDTQLFIAMMEKTLPHNFYRCKKRKHYLKELGKTIGTNNKFIIMSKSSVHIINEKSGHWLDGIWYSNYSYLPYSWNSVGLYGFTGEPNLKTGIVEYPDVFDDEEGVCPTCRFSYNEYDYEAGYCLECGTKMKKDNRIFITGGLYKGI